MELSGYIEPLQVANEKRLEGESVAMKSGDIHFACINRLKHCATSYWSGKNLSEVEIDFSNTSKFIKMHGHKTCLFFLMPMQRSLLALIRGNEKDLYISCENLNARQLTVTYFNNLFLALLLNNGDIRFFAEKCTACSKKESWVLAVPDARRKYILGLASYHVFRGTKDPIWLERGRNCKTALGFWSEKGSVWNFRHQYELLQAEDHYSNGHFETAQKFYEHAIVTARSHKFFGDEALACELAANFFFTAENMAASMDHFRLAHEKYCQWGARFKAESLFESIKEKFAGAFQGGASYTPTPAVNFGQADEGSSRKRTVNKS